MNLAHVFVQVAALSLMHLRAIVGDDKVGVPALCRSAVPMKYQRGGKFEPGEV